MLRDILCSSGRATVILYVVRVFSFIDQVSHICTSHCNKNGKGSMPEGKTKIDHWFRNPEGMRVRLQTQKPKVGASLFGDFRFTGDAPSF